MQRFYGFFVSAYGTFWIVLHTSSVITQSSIQMGEIGYCGFPIVAFIYALIRVATSENKDEVIETLQRRVTNLTKELEGYRDRELQRKWLRDFPDVPDRSSTDIKPVT
jgi:hypothetical protein